MSFLSRRPSRPDQNGGRAGASRQADAEYGDYGYAPDDYRQDDDNWSPDQYFSPEGIKGRWAAGARPGERAGGRGPRDDERGYDGYRQGPQQARGPAGGYGRDSYQQDSYGQDDGYGGDEYGSGAYEVMDGPDDDRGERSGGRKRRADRGERRLRLGRRDKGEDIWPDDGVSDEDYWASVAADRPFSSGGPSLDADPVNVVNNRPMARPAGESRLPADRPLAAEPRYAGESRTGSGRLGPAPGLAAGYPPAYEGTGSRPMPGGPSGANSGPMARPGTGPNSGPMARPGTGPIARPGTGPMARPGAGANSGPMARPGTGPNSGPMARPGTGPSPARPAAGPNATGPHPARAATGPHPMRAATGPHPTRAAAGPTPMRAPTGPAPTRGATGPSPARPAIGPNARPAAGLAQPGFNQPSMTQPTVAQPVLAQSSARSSLAQPSFQPNTARGAGRPPERSDWTERTERIDRITPGYPDPRATGRGQAPAAAAPVSVWGRGGSADQHPPTAGTSRRGADDDPLTSKAWSREELVNTDGRSYRGASRRAQVSADRYEAAVTEQTQTFSMNGQHQAGAQGRTGHYPVPGGQQQSRQAANPYDGGTASYPYPGQPYPSKPAAAEQDDDRVGRPARQGGGQDSARNPNPGYGYSTNGYNGGYGNGRY